MQEDTTSERQVALPHGVNFAILNPAFRHRPLPPARSRGRLLQKGKLNCFPLHSTGHKGHENPHELLCSISSFSKTQDLN